MALAVSAGHVHSLASRVAQSASGLRVIWIPEKSTLSRFTWGPLNVGCLDLGVVLVNMADTLSQLGQARTVLQGILFPRYGRAYHGVDVRRPFLRPLGLRFAQGL